MTAKFFKGVGQLPVDRSGGSASEAALRTGLKVLGRGDCLGIYPEGTRSPDGELYRGKTGVARMALEAGVPVLPVAMIDTEKIQPPGRKMPTLGIRVGIKIGAPLDFSRYEGMEGDRFVLRSITDEIMYELMELSGQEYVDIYARSPRTGSRPSGPRRGPPRRPTSDAAATPAEPTATRPAGCLTPWASRPRCGGRWRSSALLGLLYAVAVYVRRYDEYAHPVGGWVVLGLMAAWTVVVDLALRAAAPGGPGRSWASTWPSRWRRSCRSRWLDDTDRIAGGRADPARRLGGRAGAGLGDPGRLAGRGRCGAGRSARPTWCTAAR